ncbi:hypothetical protein I4300191C4_12290 [Solibaculum mannosilyticum]
MMQQKGQVKKYGGYVKTGMNGKRKSKVEIQVVAARCAQKGEKNRNKKGL